MLSLCILFQFGFYCQQTQEGVTQYQSFSIDNKEVVWMQIYHEDSTTATDLSTKVFNHLKKKVWISDIHYDGQEIVADIKNYKMDYKRYGGKFMKTSNIIRTGNWSGKLRIGFKDGKYRIIIYGLHYIARQPANTAGKLTIESHSISGTWSEWVLNNFRNAFRQSRFFNMDIVHLNLKDSFTLNTNQLIDSDW